MCKKQKGLHNRIDPCIKKFIKWLNYEHVTVASCCGHGVYPMTVVVAEVIDTGKNKKTIFREIFSGIVFNPRRKIYKKGKKGIYFIPEVENARNRTNNS